MEFIPQTFECPRDAYWSNAILVGINPHSYLGLSIPSFSPYSTLWDSLMAQMAKHLPAKWVSDHTVMIIYVMKIFFVQFCVFLPPLLNIFCFC